MIPQQTIYPASIADHHPSFSHTLSKEGRAKREEQRGRALRLRDWDITAVRSSGSFSTECAAAASKETYPSERSWNDDIGEFYLYILKHVHDLYIL